MNFLNTLVHAYIFKLHNIYVLPTNQSVFSFVRRALANHIRVFINCLMRVYKDVAIHAPSIFNRVTINTLQN